VDSAIVPPSVMSCALDGLPAALTVNAFVAQTLMDMAFRLMHSHAGLGLYVGKSLMATNQERYLPASASFLTGVDSKTHDDLRFLALREESDFTKSFKSAHWTLRARSNKL
jgi:hypothetical protein